MKKNDKAYTNKLFEENQKLVYMVYNQLTARHTVSDFDKEDVIQEGMLGLFRGAESYDPNLGYSESTYLCACIKHAMWNTIYANRKASNCISLDCPVFPDSEESLGDLIPEDTSVVDLPSIDFYVDLYKKYHPKSNIEVFRGILKELADGGNFSTAAKKLNLSRERTSSIIRDFRTLLIKENIISNTHKEHV